MTTLNPSCEANPSNRRKIIILGGGPNRIGQGIEFDYCCVHAAYALKETGFETIMVNCNPETVSTDYDTSDRLYFEPLTSEDVLEIIRKEQENGELIGVIVQFGGQTPLKLARTLEAAFVPIIGTSPDSIDLAEDRDRFRALINQLKLKQPKSAIGRTPEEVISQAEQIGFPLLVRPSYVLGGRAMATMHDLPSLEKYVHELAAMFGDGPILIDSFLKDAVEVDVDAICDGSHVLIAGVMQHIEEAGIHSGDSACVLPPYSLPKAVQEKIQYQAALLAKALNVKGLMNAQFAVKEETTHDSRTTNHEPRTTTHEIYLIEVNPRASRTVPFVAKTIDIPIAKIAARVMAGEKLADLLPKRVKFSSLNLTEINEKVEFAEAYSSLKHVAVKEAVFPFARFPGVDVILGPEMKSTGEAMGIDDNFPASFAKSQLAAGTNLPKSGKIFISVRESDKPAAINAAKALAEAGFSLVATRGTASYLKQHGLEVTIINKVREGRPHIVDSLKDREIAMVINTTEGKEAVADSFSIRRTALLNKIPYYTTMAEAAAASDAIKAMVKGKALDVKSIQEYAKAI